jgi:hypothetical protein
MAARLRTAPARSAARCCLSRPQALVGWRAHPPRASRANARGPARAVASTRAAAPPTDPQADRGPRVPPARRGRADRGAARGPRRLRRRGALPAAHPGGAVPGAGGRPFSCRGRDGAAARAKASRCALSATCMVISQDTGRMKAARRGIAEGRGAPAVPSPARPHSVSLTSLPCHAPLPRRPPTQVLTAALYAESGVRGVEIGSSCFGHVDPETGKFTPARLELLRLAVPRRVYSDNHVSGHCSLLSWDGAWAALVPGRTALLAGQEEPLPQQASCLGDVARQRLAGETAPFRTQPFWRLVVSPGLLQNALPYASPARAAPFTHAPPPFCSLPAPLQLRYVAAALARLYARRHTLSGLRRVYATPLLSHFTARFEPLDCPSPDCPSPDCPASGCPSDCPAPPSESGGSEGTTVDEPSLTGAPASPQAWEIAGSGLGVVPAGSGKGGDARPAACGA